MNTAERVAIIVGSIERAALSLHPLVIDGDTETAKAAHDALNALTAARANAELFILTEGAAS